MQLMCIFDVQKDPGLTKKYENILRTLREKYGQGDSKSLDPRVVCEKYRCGNQYAKEVHTGRLKEGVELNELELSMSCNNGFSYYGGTSHIFPDRTFQVVIWTD